MFFRASICLVFFSVICFDFGQGQATQGGGSCVDNWFGLCPILAGSGYCDTNCLIGSWTQAGCRKSCGKCAGPTTAAPTTAAPSKAPINNAQWCAKLFQHTDYKGWVILANETNNGQLTGNKNNAVSSVEVRKGCTLKAYRNNLKDLIATVTGKISWNYKIDKALNKALNDKMSSYTCQCGGPTTAGPTSAAPTKPPTKPHTTKPPTKLKTKPPTKPPTTTTTTKPPTTLVPVHCKWNAWKTGPCSKTCGGGTQTNTRTIQIAASNGGKSCTGKSRITVVCNSVPCVLDCQWNAWKTGKCSKTCGGGTQTRTRTKQIEAAHGGKPCPGKSSITVACDKVPCPVDCQWNSWKNGKCSKTCGGGKQTNARTKKIEAAHGGKACTGKSSIAVACNSVSCPVDCQWNDWKSGKCSKTCGSGTQTNTRTKKIEAAHGGKACTGPTSIYKYCNTNKCPVFAAAVKTKLLKRNSDVDVAFMMDATASMGRNIASARRNVANIVNRIKSTFKSATVRVALVAYRDYSEGRRRFEILDFTANVPRFVAFMGRVRAFRGGDIAEDVLGALDKTINLNWKAPNKLFFQIGDAPPRGFCSEGPYRTRGWRRRFRWCRPRHRLDRAGPQAADLFRRIDAKCLKYNVLYISSKQYFMVKGFTKIAKNYGGANRFKYFDMRRRLNFNAVTNSIIASIRAQLKKTNDYLNNPKGKKDRCLAV